MIKAKVCEFRIAMNNSLKGRIFELLIDGLSSPLEFNIIENLQFLGTSFEVPITATRPKSRGVVLKKFSMKMSEPL